MDAIYNHALQLRNHMHDRIDTYTPQSRALYDHTRHLVESIEMKKDYNHIHDQAKQLQNEIHNLRNAGVFNHPHYQELYHHAENMRREIEIMKMQGRLK